MSDEVITLDESIRENDVERSRMFCTEYRRQLDALQLIHQLNQMVKTVQRHRGMSMALLAGSDLFKVEFAVLQKQVERRLTSLQVFVEQTRAILSERDQECLQAAWHTIRADWQDDDVIDNFELHSHFIEQLQNMVTRLSKTIERPASRVVSESLGGAVVENTVEEKQVCPNMFRRVELLSFAANQMPQMVEQIAKIRGLSAYSVRDDNYERKLRYAMVCAKTLNEKIRVQAECLKAVLGEQLDSLFKMKAVDVKLTYFLSTVELDVLTKPVIASNSHKLFILATEIIDVYLSVVNESMKLVARWHEQDLEDWLCEV